VDTLSLTRSQCCQKAEVRWRELFFLEWKTADSIQVSNFVLARHRLSSHQVRLGQVRLGFAKGLDTICTIRYSTMLMRYLCSPHDGMTDGQLLDLLFLNTEVIIKRSIGESGML
jgi:hypothetical protein